MLEDGTGGGGGAGREIFFRGREEKKGGKMGKTEEGESDLILLVKKGVTRRFK